MFVSILLNNKIYIGLGLYVIAFNMLTILRRIQYMEGKALLSCLGSTAYFISMLIFVYIFMIVEKFNTESVFFITSISAIVGFITIAIVGRANFLKINYDKSSLFNIALEHWKVGYWFALASIVGWFVIKAYAPLISIFDSNQSAGFLKAVDNILSPVQQLITSLSVLIIPFVFKRAKGDLKLLYNYSVTFGVITSIFVIVYVAFLFFLGKYLIVLLYGQNNSYLSISWSLPILGFTLFSRSMGDAGFGIFIRGTKEARIFFESSFYSALNTLIIGSIFIHLYGYKGAVIGNLLSSFIYLMVISLKTKHLKNKLLRT